MTLSVTASERGNMVLVNFYYSTSMYSKNWKQKIFSFATTYYFDIIFSEEGLFLMKHPPSTAEATEALFGRLVGDMVKRLDTKIGGDFRDSWLDKDNNLVREEYKKYAYLFISKDEIKNKVTVKNYLFSSLVTICGDKKIKLTNTVKAGSELKTQMNSLFI